MRLDGLDAEAFEELRSYFETRLELLSLNAPPVDADDQPFSRRGAPTRRDAIKREAYRRAFKPDTPVPHSVLKDDSTDDSPKEESVFEEAAGNVVVNVDRSSLQQRLKEKISSLREQTGVAKIKKKSLQQKKAARQARRDKKRRRKHALHNARGAPAPNEPNSAAVPRSIVLNDVKENAAMPHSRPRKRKLAEKFRKLSLAQRQQESVVQFTQTGQGGEKVLQQEWVHALERASGKKVLDDPKRLQKSIDDVFKRKAKSAKQWEARRKQEAEEKQERQEKRKRNLQRRTEQRKKRKELHKAKAQL